MNTPVLLIFFNRPKHLQKLLEQLKKIQPKNLFFACDGPRYNNETDKQAIAANKKHIEEITWESKKSYLYLGCKEAVTTAINWFFSNVSEGIILEDDCIPNASFFKFCETVLKLYENDESIMHIGGTNFLVENNSIKESYYFSKIAHVWGWASWRRAWYKYDKNLVEYTEERLINIFQNAKLPKSSYTYWKEVLEDVKSGNINTWDYQWNYSIWINNGFTIIPYKNLISNIGFDSSGTHTHETSPFANMPTKELDIIVHPSKIEHNISNDTYSFRKWFSKKNIVEKIIERLRRINNGM